MDSLKEPLTLVAQDIRARFLEILEASGIEASQFPSIDDDEDFGEGTVRIYWISRG